MFSLANSQLYVFHINFEIRHYLNNFIVISKIYALTLTLNVEPAIITGRRAFEPNDGHWSVFDVNEAAMVTKLFDNLSKHIIWTLAYILTHLFCTVLLRVLFPSSTLFSGARLPSLTAEKSSGCSNNEKWSLPICYMLIPQKLSIPIL